MKRTLSAVVIMLALSIMPAQAAIYYWNGAGGDSLWTNANNWNPVRTTPASGDTISFNNGAADTVIGVPTESISALLVGINTKVYLHTTAGTRKTLTVGNYLAVNSGCQLNLYGATDSLTIFVAAGGVGQISGSMTFSGMAQKLNANDVNAIQFNPGSSLTQNCAGNAFTAAGTAGVIVFNAGSEFIQYAGSNPFGLTQPASKVQFLAGSWFRCRMSSNPAFSGRSYANFELDYPAFSAIAIGGNPTSIDTLKITDGKLTLSLSRITIKGDILIAAAETLQFRQAVGGGATICSLKFYGTAPQTIGSGGTLLFMNDSTSVYVDNAAGLTIDRAFQVRANLALFNGIVTANDTLKMMSDQTIQRTNGYIVGPLAMHVATGATLKTFPVGTANGYSPVAVVPSGITAAGYLTCQAVQATHPDAAVPANTMQRYWKFNNDGVALDSYQMALWYLPGDFNSGFTQADNESTMVVAKYGAAAWSFPSILGRDTAANYVEIFGNAFSDFTMGKDAAAFVVPDTTHPTIILTDPADGAIDVPLDKILTIAFSEPMTVPLIGVLPSPYISLMSSWNSTADTLTLSPSGTYDYNALYTITLMGTDIAGNELNPNPDSFQFTTIANQKPVISVVQQPADTYDSAGPFLVRAVITDPGKAGIVADTLYYTAGGDWQFVVHSAVNGDTMTYSIPGPIAAGTVVEYYVGAYDDAGAYKWYPDQFAGLMFRVLKPLAPDSLIATGQDMAVALSWKPPSEEINYSLTNNTGFFQNAGNIITTRFTPQHYPCKLEQAVSSWWYAAGSDSVEVHVWPDNGTGIPDTTVELVPPFSIMPLDYPALTVIDLSPQNIFLLSGDFHVGYVIRTTNMPMPCSDGNGPGVRSMVYDFSASSWGNMISGGNTYNDWYHQAVVSYSSYSKGLAMAKNITQYEVGRSLASGGAYSWIVGTSGLTYTDNAAANGTQYYYVVRALYTTPDTFSAYSNEASATPYGVEGQPGVESFRFFLDAAGPNPLTSNAVVQFSLARQGQVSIVVYNVAGQKVKTLVDANLNAGQHSVNWNGRNEGGQKVAAGMYMYRMVSGDFSATRKLVVIR
jgi:hypothetical protein